MVSLTDVQLSNSKIASTLPGLVAVFVGSTSGIGEYALKQFAKYARQPRVYFVGRSQEAGHRIAAECKALSFEGKGEFIFIKADVSLIKNVDDVCRDIKSKEKAINLLWLSQGTLLFGTKTSENMHFATVLAYHSRIRFIVNLLPLLQQAASIRRVVTCLAATKEGEVFTNDFNGWNVSLRSGRGHIASMLTLALEILAQKAPDVAFIHDYPGYVRSNIIRGGEGALMFVVSKITKLMARFIAIPNEESGDRHVYYLTSARYPASKDTASGVPLVSGTAVATGTDGKIGSGVYNIDENGESGGAEVQEILAKLRTDGVVEKLWAHTEEEYTRITGSLAI